jgi:acyl-CoA synthetase (AMP-forming)/AMP-acid ligase II
VALRTIEEGTVHPGVHAENTPDKPAIIMAGSGDALSYGELDDMSRRLATYLEGRELREGDHVAVLLENRPEYFAVIWAALRAGLYITPINWHLGPEEAGYVIGDCGARALISSTQFPGLIGEMGYTVSSIETRLSLGGTLEGFAPLEREIGAVASEPRENDIEGSIMYYSSGTTGRPKGIKPPLRHTPLGSNPALVPLLQFLYSMTPESVYLCPAPLYHAAPLGFTTSAQRLGATVVVMESFDAEGVLRAIEQYSVTHTQFVPTHFVRMLRLPDDVRNKYDLSSLEVAIHAAAPCPVHVKQAMIDWWGPKIYEYYAGSEGIGFVAVTPEEWVKRPGTVGKTVLGTIHILDEDGIEQPPMHDGQIWFDSGATFEYHGDPDKTRSVFNEQGWSTLGDIGYLDEDDYLFLTDRASNMIISGGVNIYPLEIENVLTLHDGIADVAVVGIPDEEFGESIKAFVALEDGVTGDDELTGELVELCHAHLARFKCPRHFEYVDSLPRLANGKLLKRKLPGMGG